ncbi:MAG: L,D-transpeptidase, partial [bacterium]|nr:L,D-transpeptidase [bacterium]
FIFIPMPGELSPIVSGEKWVEVDRANQILHAYVDGREVFQAPIGVGLSWTPTPLGEGYKVLDRIFNETMSGEGYHVQNVLFTMYFTGDISIHLDWWHDDSYFGNEPTSHGCVGLQLHNAQWIWLFGFEEMRVRIYE